MKAILTLIGLASVSVGFVGLPTVWAAYFAGTIFKPGMSFTQTCDLSIWLIAALVIGSITLHFTLKNYKEDE